MKIDNKTLGLLIIFSLVPNVISFSYGYLHGGDLYKINDCKDLTQFKGNTLSEQLIRCENYDVIVKFRAALLDAYFISSILVTIPMISGLIVYKQVDKIMERRKFGSR